MIALLTPTGGRPTQIRLLAKWMQRQTYTGQVLWILVDDCNPTTVIDNMPSSFPPNWTIIKVFPRPVYQGINTQGRNLRAAITELKKWDKITSVFIIEDDDYYSPNYLRMMVAYLNDYDLVGEANSLYYDVTNKTYNECGNIRHASLFQTAFNVSLLHDFEKMLNGRFFDINFWKTDCNKKIVQSRLAVGIKGQPGRSGIGMGHRKHLRNQDPEGRYLKQTIGTDAQEYE